MASRLLLSVALSPRKAVGIRGEPAWLLNGNFQKDVLRRWAEAVIQLGQWRRYEDGG